MILADTSIWIDLLMHPGRVTRQPLDVDDLVTCGPVIQEVLQGFADTEALPTFRKRLLSFPCLGDPTPVELFLKAAEIYREGRRKGYTIRSATDCLIAAIAMEHDAAVWHRDRDYTTIARFTTLKVHTHYLT